MQVKFKISETVETEIYHGFYAVYILGGHSVEANPDFHLEIKNTETGKSVELTEKRFKARDYKFGRKAVRFYTFDIGEYGKYKISAHNYQDIIVKDSILEVFPFPFSIPHLLFSRLMGKTRKSAEINTIEILIE